MSQKSLIDKKKSSFRLRSSRIHPDEEILLDYREEDKLLIEREEEEYNKKREAMAKNRSQRREQQAETERLCALHRQRLEQMEPARRVFFTDDSGEQVRMDDDQRMALIDESRAYVDSNCNG